MNEDTVIELITKYFYNKNEIDFIQTKITLLTRQITDIESDIKNTNISIENAIGSIRYDTDKLDIGYKEIGNEKSLVNAITKLEVQVIEKKRELIELKLESHKIEVDILDFERVLDKAGIEDEILELLKLKHLDSLTNVKIGIELNKNESTVRKHLNESYTKILFVM